MRMTGWLAGTVLALAAAGAAVAQMPAPVPQPTVTLGGQRFSVELATTPAAQAHGLMDRISMPAAHGMLFVFPDSAPRTFWMKDTLIPLDILFFDTRRRLVTIQANAQPCKADPCRLYPSNAPARYVLELNAGTAARLGLHNGDAMSFRNVSSDIQ